MYGEDTSNVLSVIDLVLTIPATSAEAERGFSVMKRIKTDFRYEINTYFYSYY